VRPYAWIPVALLLGLVLGSWGPKSEIRKLREDLEAARAGAGTVKRTARIEGVTELLGISAAAAAASAPMTADVSETSADATNPPVPVADNTATGALAVSQGPPPGETPPGRNRPRPRNLEGQIERAAELWRMRSDVARAAFVSDAELTDADAGTFDVLTTAMNLRLANSIETWVEGIKGGDAPGPEAGIRLARDVTDSLVLTYEEMDRKLSEGWRDRLEEPLNLTDFIDPAVATPLVDVEDALEHSAGWEPRAGREGTE